MVARVTGLLERSPIRAALLLQVLFLIVGFFGAIVSGLAHALTFPGSRQPDWLSIASGNVAAGLFLLLLVRRLGWLRQVVGLRAAPRPSPLLWTLALLPAILGGAVDTLTSGSQRELSGVIGLELFAEFSAVAVAEELLYRGILITALASRGVPLAVWVSALLFGLSHLPNALAFPLPAIAAQVVFTAGAGALWAAVRVKGGVLWPVVVAHFAAETVRYVLGFSLTDTSPAHLLLQVALGCALAAVAVATLARVNAAIGVEQIAG